MRNPGTRHEYEEHPLPRGTLTERILDILSSGAQTSSALFEIASREITNFSMRPRYTWGRASTYTVDWADSYREAKSFHALLYKLRQNGFVASAGKRRQLSWRLTRHGRAKLGALRERFAFERLTDCIGTIAPDGKTRIVTYDVPERERKKRWWLHEVLREVGYEPLQRSVWIGERPLHEDFFRALRRQRILTCVHVIEVGKSGTIKQTS